MLVKCVYIHVYVASATDTSTDNGMALFVSCRVGLERDEVDSWILIGEPSRKYPGIHCKKYVCMYMYVSLLKTLLVSRVSTQLVGDILHSMCTHVHVYRDCYGLHTDYKPIDYPPVNKLCTSNRTQGCSCTMQKNKTG